jgi:signal transduction histidine kinase
MLRRCLPATLFGRLAALLLVFALLSHVLALTLMFELRPPPPPAWLTQTAAPAGAPPPPPPPAPSGPMPWWSIGLLADVAVRLLALTLAAWIGARWLSNPMRRLAAAAEQLSQVMAPGAPQDLPGWVPEEGPRECQDAARSFNRMRRQLQQQMQERDRFVAAVSHDLRTPLTRLRLRAESLTDEDQRSHFERDVRDMDQTLRVTLDYLLGSAAAEAVVPTDAAALAHQMARDQAALGRAVRCSGQARPLPLRPLALRRCLDNLVENALRYAGDALINVQDEDEGLCIRVRDHGPGIPPESLQRVLEPFVRLETSRNRRHGGHGLGLAIAADIARQHGGSLQLHNAPDGGLVAALRLPRRAADPVPAD